MCLGRHGVQETAARGFDDIGVQGVPSGDGGNGFDGLEIELHGWTGFTRA
jgi:hypothetical protein